MHTLEQLRAGELGGARHLKLSENLTTFPPEILSLKETLEVLDLTGNQLSTLPDELAECARLRILFCSENRFTELPEVLGRCPSLTMVGFKANRIARVSEASLPAALRWLILTDNEIESLPDALGLCHGLQKLMLAGNRLTTLPDLARCRRLELVRLSANRLGELPSSLLALPRLSWLAFAGNPCCVEPARGESPAIPWDALHLGELLGEGASGRIFSARLPGERPVAVKLFKGAMTSDGLPRSEMGAALAAGRHRALIPLLGEVVDHPQGVPALVMDLIEPAFAALAGPPSLDSCTRDVYAEAFCLSLPAVCQLLWAIASVGAHLHARGILHGDLYGHNILHNGAGRALLGDFGAASCYEPGSALGLALERIEVRAFGCLIEELLARSTGQDATASALSQLALACLSESGGDRPVFAELAARLATLARPVGSRLPLA
ncbi:leucine-rich repeat-containing protein kinase family protein [Aeromonas diversa]|uniref:leucine-rich repeat-containing protein kinase family protein n=1 Tax=Aeromonas diversa TaxID=502790 RepID=UPI0005B77F25|nr:leucine-rich repeat-containing protein kinase family protein [Aeromonas diversa]